MHHILNANHKHRIAVIVNEYGDTSGIESAAVTCGEVSQNVQHNRFIMFTASPSAMQAMVDCWNDASCT